MAMDRTPRDRALLDAVAGIVHKAGAAVMEVYARDFDIEIKDDNSPVTEADHASEAVILPSLSELAPDIPAISEEAAAAGYTPMRKYGRFWLVDPLDGTKQFIKRAGDFTVNIGLVEGKRPTLGVMGVPARGEIYGGFGDGSGDPGSGEAWLWKTGGVAPGDPLPDPEPIACRAAPAAGLTVVASRSHGDTDMLDRFLGDFTVGELVNYGSAVKLGMIARGAADLYPRFGRTMEWDTAAGDAILRAAGGMVETPEGDPFVYGKPDFANGHFIAFGRRG